MCNFLYDMRYGAKGGLLSSERDKGDRKQVGNRALKFPVRADSPGYLSCTKIPSTFTDATCVTAPNR